MNNLCSVCGKKEGTHYFGKIKVPVGKGEHKVVAHDDILDIDVVRWTGKHIRIDYWECDDCYGD